MKNFTFPVIALLAALIISTTVAMAANVVADPGLTAKNGVVVQDIVPKASKSNCVSIGAGRATQYVIPTTGTAGTSAINWVVYATPLSTSPGTATVVKKKLKVGTVVNTASMQNSIGTNEKIDRSTSAVVFERYSSNTTLNLCYELN